MRKPNITLTSVTKSVFLLAILLLPFVSIPSPRVLAGDGAIWIPFVPGVEPETRSQVLAKSADTMGLCVDSSFFGMHSLATYINETKYNVLNVPSAGHTTALGKPSVPMITRYLEVPHNVNVSFQILYRDMQVLDGYNVIPAQEFPADFINATEAPFVIDETTYTTNAFYPSDVASLEGVDGLDPIVIRGHRIVALSLCPVQFNPVTQQVRVYSKIEARLNYDKPGQFGAIDGRLLSSAFETLLEALVLNYRYPEVLPLKKAGSAEYLIITHDAFFQQVQELAAWKEQKGLLTKVVNTTQISATGPTADDIATYIQNAYDTWNPAPSYILLVGDSDFIPPHYRNPSSSIYHGGFDIPTDLYYATVDGTDYFPDIYIGRLSVDTTAQATTITDKIINYERNPPANAAFYNQVVACALFQDKNHTECGVRYPVPDGYEDRRYVLTSEEIRDFLLNQGYNVDRIYWADPGNPWVVPPIPAVNPTNYSICQYSNGDPLPPALLRANGFLWDGDDLDVTNAITAGRFLVYHRDHGESRNFWDHRPAARGGQAFGGIDGWNHPLYTTGNIAGLANAPLLPVVFSVECQSGWFDGEVDQINDPALIRTFESFSEEFVRQPNGGAIAAIGSTRNSFSGYNDDMLKGFVDAIWPGFDPNFMSGGLFSLGQVLTYGKVYMATQYGYAGTHTRETFELFHLFGDPELAIWTEQPRELDVTYPTHIGSKGLQKFVINVTDHDTGAPVHHAKVCLKKESEVYAVAYTDPSGGAYFAVNPSTGGEMKITVTKHNYRHYEGLITVTSDGATLSVDAAIGPSGIFVSLQGDNFDDGETVDIYFGDTTPDTTVDARAGSFTEDFGPVPTGPVGPLNVRAVGQTSDRTAVTLFRRLPDQPLPDPYIYCQWDSSTWHLNPGGGDPRWNNPDIQLYDATTGAQVASNDLRVGTTYTVEATVHNDATVDATNTVVTFQWAFWGAGQKDWILMGSDQVTVPDGGQGTAEVEWTPSITGHTCIIATIHHPWDENLNNNKGQENTHVHPVTSPGEITFTVGNPTGKDALVYVEARQVGTQDLWRTLIERDYPQVQKPGENRTVTFIVEAPSDADVGEKRIFTVSGYIDGELIGGIEVESIVKTATNISCSISPPSITLDGIITVSGSISPPVSGVTVILTYEKPDGTTFTRIVTTGPDGSYSDSCPADMVGSWTVTASWEGDSIHAGSLGSTEIFAVNTPSPSWCPILLVLIIVFIGVVLFLIRRRGREVKLLGLILIAIVVIVYVWVCVVRPA